jgi:hypothetical protein
MLLKGVGRLKLFTVTTFNLLAVKPYFPLGFNIKIITDYFFNSSSNHVQLL